MGSLDTSTPVPGPALPDIPPCSARELAVGLLDLFSKADGLTLPALVIIYASTQGFSLQFAKSAASYRALAAWAQRFGAVLASEDRADPQGQPCRYVRVTFDWFGVEVQAYAYIPVTETGT
jgi:hypothetical protein